MLLKPYTKTMVDQNKAVVREFLDELTNKLNSTAWEKYCSEGFTQYFNSLNFPNNFTGAKQLTEQMIAAFPDANTTINLLIAEGDWVVAQASTKATHRGIFMGIAATGKSVEWEETHCYRLMNGKILEQYLFIRVEKIGFELGGESSRIYIPQASSLNSIISMVIGVFRFILPKMKLNQNSLFEKNREIVRLYIDRFKNQQDFLTFPQLFNPQKFTHHFRFTGRDSKVSTFVSVGREFLKAFPDVRVNVIKLIADGDYVVELNTVVATHKGSYFNVPATNKTVRWSEAHIYRLQNERIIENIPAVNFENIIHQII